MKDKVSVIVLVDNIETYISRCIESIIKQTYNNLEIVLVNKDSKDNSLKLCNYYKKIDKRIKLIHLPIKKVENLKNIGIDSATGKYITIIDGHDYVKPNYIEYMLNLMKTNKADIVCTTSYKKNEKSIVNVDEDIYNDKEILANYMHMKYNSDFYAKLYKKELFDHIEYPVGTYYDDFMTTYKLFDKAKRLVNSNMKNYCLTTRRNDKITDFDRMKKIGCCFEMLTFIDEKYPELSEYCKTKICFEAIDLFTKVSDEDYKKQLCSYIKLYRHYALNDERISINKKVLCMRSIFGYNFMKFSFNVEKLLKKPIK